MNIIIADDHKIFRDGFKLNLEILENLNLLAEVSNGKELIEYPMISKCNLIFMDINMEIIDGIEATKIIKNQYPDIKIIALSSYNSSKFILNMLHAGADGYLNKICTFDEIEKAVEAIKNGKKYFSDDIMATILDNYKSDLSSESTDVNLQEFTAREKEVLYHICNGLSFKEIAKILDISLKTVEKHKSNLLQKTNCKSTTNLVIYAYKNQLVSGLD